MADRNWSAITSGATFQSLVNAILRRVDPAASPYGKLGPDGGQDARSGDSKTVYQAKYHSNATAAKAISDATRELAKIRKYKAPGHAHAPLWEGVTHWCLVTNAAFNQIDEQRWLNEVVPAFRAEGLEAENWRRENLDNLLVAHPDIDRAFFGGETRTFLSVGEAMERYRRDRAIKAGGELGRFCGRKSPADSRFLSRRRKALSASPRGWGDRENSTDAPGRCEPRRNRHTGPLGRSRLNGEVQQLVSDPPARTANGSSA